MLKEKLVEDMKQAMKAKETLKLSVIRLVRAGIQESELKTGQSLDDDGVIQVVTKEIKQRKEVIPDWIKAGREDKVLQIEKEIEYLQEYLPEQLGEEEIIEVVKEAIRNTGAQGPKQMGQVMGQVMPALKGKADGGVISSIVKRLLEEVNN